MTTTTFDVNEAYQFCLKLARSHYENFPVASLLLPKRLRLPISVIYAFARTADDFADEGSLDTNTRLQKLDEYSVNLDAIAMGSYQGKDPIFIALADVITRFELPIYLFQDLLTAFKQDVCQSRYQTFAEVLDYCHYSANPVGRLLLHLNGTADEHLLQQSDAICTSLQLINFYQDIEQDYREQNRVYIPLDLLNKAGLAPSDLVSQNSARIAPLIRPLYQRTQQILASGVELGNQLSGRFGWEIRAMTLGGVITLNKLLAQPDTQLLSRPRLNRREQLLILIRSLSRHSLSATMPELTDSQTH